MSSGRRCCALLLILVAVASWCPRGALAADVFKGQKIYETYCESCHGARGRGGMPGAPNFTRGQALLRPDPALLSSISDGRNAMPGYRGVLDTYQMLDVIAYIRTLR